MIALYVDNMLIAGSLIELVKKIKHDLLDMFEIKCSGEAKRFLKIKFMRDINRLLPHFRQEKYINKILCIFGMQSFKPVHTPMNHLPNTEGLSAPKMDSAPYRQVIGRLTYHVIETPPDLVLFVG